MHNRDTLVTAVLFIGVLLLAGCGERSDRGRATNVALQHEKAPLMHNKIAELQEKEEAHRRQLKQDIAVLKTRHPFRFTVADAAQSSILTLTGIIWDEIEPSAIINDTIVSVGDIIGDKIVIEITRTQVILLEDGEEHILQLQFEQ
jgi:hypothetical protein